MVALEEVTVSTIPIIMIDHFRDVPMAIVLAMLAVIATKVVLETIAPWQEILFRFLGSYMMVFAVLFLPLCSGNPSVLR